MRALLFVALAVFTGVLFTWLATASKPIRVAVWGIAAVLVLGAVPTLVVDVFNAQDISNARPGPGFPWTLRLSAAEVDALEWLKASTPFDAVVQPDVKTRGGATWGYMTAFGERRMAAGLPIAMIPLAPYTRATTIVSGRIFGERSEEDRASAARALGIDYIFMGPDEQRAHPGLTSALDARADLFEAAFRNAEVAIYRVNPERRHHD